MKKLSLLFAVLMTFAITSAGCDMFGGDVTRGSNISSGPDMAVHNSPLPSLSSSTVNAGNTFTVSLTIINLGDLDIPTGDNIDVGYYLSTNSTITASDTFLGFDRRTTGLSAGFLVGPFTSSVLTIPGPTTPGSYFIGIWIDDLDTLTETNENNNIYTLAITVL